MEALNCVRDVDIAERELSRSDFDGSLYKFIEWKDLLSARVWIELDVDKRKSVM